MDIHKVIESYLERSPSLVNENANQGFSMSGLKTTIAEHVLKEDLLSKSPAAAFHRTGAMHLHDSGGGEFAAYCHGGDLLNLLMTGIDNPAGTSSKPAKHFDVAVDHIVNYMYTIQNEWEGAQALSSFDTLLAPFVRADGLTQRQVKQSIQRMVYNLSYPLRAAMQTPFTNLSFDLVCPKHMAAEPSIIAGEPKFPPLADFQEEMDMINIAFCDVMLDGDCNGNPHTFPIPTYGITKEFDWDSKVANKIFDVAAKFGLPYFMNYCGSGMDPSSNRAMCCVTGDTKIISKGAHGVSYKPIKEFRNSPTNEVLINGEFEPATWFRTKTDSLRVVTFANGQTVRFSPDHPCITRRGEVRAEDVTETDWMPFSLTGYDGDGGSYNLGKFIGLYIAEGSHGTSGITFSLNSARSDLIDFVMSFASDYYGAHARITECTSPLSGKHSCVNVRISSATIENLVGEYVRGSNALDKHLASKMFKMSREFRQGVFDGEFLGDGSSRKRVCTVSPQLAEDFCCLISSLGAVAGLIVDDRDSSCGKLSDNPLYLVRPYNVHGTRTKYKDVYEIDGDQIWIKVRDITSEIGRCSVYDFEMDTEDHLFQLANGLITHNCRLQMDLNEIIEKTKGGLWNTGVNTGSLSVVTINLPQLGYISRTMSRSSDGAQTIDSTAFSDMHSIFFSRLNTLLDAARRHNVWKRERINIGFELGLMPFTKSYLKNFEKFFSTIGVVGMNECCLNMFGKPIWQCENFVESVLSHIHGYVRDLTKEYGYPWNFEETPAEGCSHSLAVKDKQVYPDIITQGEGDGVFYTNSSHIYVGDELSLGDSLNIQQKFKSYYNGGTLFHIFCGESNPDRDGLKDLIRNICTNTTIPYLALTRAYAVCPGCGVSSDLSGVCPDCGAETTVWDRVTGYYRPQEKYNPGKQAEFLARKRFEVG